MRQQELQDHLADPVDLLGAGSDDQAVFHVMNTGRDDIDPAIGLGLDDAEPAAPIGLQLVVVAERGNRDARTPGRLKDGRPLRGRHLIAVDLQADLTHVLLLFLTNRR